MPNPDTIQKALAEILSHKIFISSPKSSALLAYIVQETLNDRANLVNETTIAQDVYKKGATYDPAKASLVRVSVRRVRNMLKLYYAETPHAAVIITVPSGQYIAQFKTLKAFDESSILLEQSVESSLRMSLNSLEVKKRAFWTKLSVGSVGLICIGLIVSHFLFILNNPAVLQRDAPAAIDSVNPQFNSISQYPRIAVTPFKNLTKQPEFDFLESALQRKVVEDLLRFELMRPRVYEGSIETLSANYESIFDYAISSLILSVEPELDILVKLTDLKTGSVVFDTRIRQSMDATVYLDDLSTIAKKLGGRFTSELSQDRIKFIKEQVNFERLNAENLDVFACTTLSREAMRYPNEITFQKSYTCLNNQLKENPDNAVVLSSFGNLIMVATLSEKGVYKINKIAPNMRAKHGMEMIKRAAEISPYIGKVQYDVSAGYIMFGDRQAGLKHARLAYIANPGSPDIIMHLSRLLAGDGEFDRASFLAQEALDRNPDLNIEYRRILFLMAVVKNMEEDMMVIAQSFANDDYRYAYLYQYLAAIANDDQVLLESLRPRVMEAFSRDGNSKRILNLMTEYGTDEVRKKFSNIFLAGGVPMKIAEVENHQ